MPDPATSTLRLAAPWPSLIQRFLVEKQRRSGSDRTVESYGRLLRSFAMSIAKPPAQVGSADVFKFVDHIGASGRSPSTATVGARLTCLSSFFQFLVRLGHAPANPCDAVARPKARPAAPRGLTADEVRRLLAAVPETPLGLRDRAIILMLFMTGRRRAEVLRLRAGDLEAEGSKVYYRYRGKGGKRGRQELPPPVVRAIERQLTARGTSLAELPADGPLWPADGLRMDRGVSAGMFAAKFRGYLVSAGMEPTGVHVLRHTAAKLRRQAGATIQDIAQFLDHSSLAITTTYLRQLEGQADQHWRKVATALEL